MTEASKASHSRRMDDGWQRQASEAKCDLGRLTEATCDCGRPPPCSNSRESSLTGHSTTAVSGSPISKFVSHLIAMDCAWRWVSMTAPDWFIPYPNFLAATAPNWTTRHGKPSPAATARRFLA